MARTFCFPFSRTRKLLLWVSVLHLPSALVALKSAVITGSIFDVVLDGTLIFSRKQAGRFPELAELLDKIPAQV